MPLLDDCYTSFLNLDRRPDRREHMENELARVGITNAERTRGKLPDEFDLKDPKLQVMKNRTAGAIGCHFGQVEIMQKALELRKHAFVMEDDLIFCSDFQERMEIVGEYLKDKYWNIFWLGGTYHANNPAWWHRKGHSPDLPQCKCKHEVDVLPTEDDRFVRTLGAFSTHAYIVNKNFIEILLDFLDRNIHMSMGIDWLMILMQPMIYTYAFVPGMCIQMDGQSDIGMCFSKYSQFHTLGSHWFQDRMIDFDYKNFKI